MLDPLSLALAGSAAVGYVAGRWRKKHKEAKEAADRAHDQLVEIQRQQQEVAINNYILKKQLADAFAAQQKKLRELEEQEKKYERLAEQERKQIMRDDGVQEERARQLFGDRDVHKRDEERENKEEEEEQGKEASECKQQ